MKIGTGWRLAAAVAFLALGFATAAYAQAGLTKKQKEDLSDNACSKLAFFFPIPGHTDTPEKKRQLTEWKRLCNENAYPHICITARKLMRSNGVSDAGMTCSQSPDDFPPIKDRAYDFRNPDPQEAKSDTACAKLSAYAQSGMHDNERIPEWKEQCNKHPRKHICVIVRDIMRSYQLSDSGMTCVNR